MKKMYKIWICNRGTRKTGTYYDVYTSNNVELEEERIAEIGFAEMEELSELSPKEGDYYVIASKDSGFSEPLRVIKNRHRGSQNFPHRP